MIFSDFDGTITEQETFSLLMKEFAPEASRSLIPRLLSREITLREGVPAILETIESSRYPEMVARMTQAPLRPGFLEFLDLLEKLDIPLVVLSGSLEGLVMARLKPYINRISRVVAARADTTGPFLKIISDYADRDELVYKPGVLAKYPDKLKIAIGDSVTDISMAKSASLVFARSLLAERMKKNSWPFEPFESFFDISRFIETMQKEGQKKQ
jgi:2-hydroxy-3-keto-5-methylthiopentenyl-1-phosphate phosphatase